MTKQESLDLNLKRVIPTLPWLTLEARKARQQTSRRAALEQLKSIIGLTPEGERALQKEIAKEEKISRKKD